MQRTGQGSGAGQPAPDGARDYADVDAGHLDGRPAQFYNLLPALTARENVEIVRELVTEACAMQEATCN